jgi:hypothetical protein
MAAIIPSSVSGYALLNSFFAKEVMDEEHTYTNGYVSEISNKYS